MRKRIHLKREQYPSPVKAIALFDKFIIVAGIFSAVATIPQLTQIWISQDAEGVSVVSWAYYAFNAVMFLIYGIIHKEKPIIINYAVALILDIFVTIGAVIYS